MNSTFAIDTLRAHQDELEAIGLTALFLFGSVARDEAHQYSDINLLAAQASGRFCFFSLMRAQDACTKILGRRVEMMEYEAFRILEDLRTRIEPDLRRIF